MARYIAIILCLIFFVFSVNSVVHEDKKDDPSLEIIKQQDAEEGIDFQRLKDIEDDTDNEKKSEHAPDDLPIYPLQDKDKDDPQCPDPTPVRGTMKVLHGHPFSYGCNVLLTCDPGLVFEDGKSVWNLTCLGLPVMPPTCMWAPAHDGTPICKEPELSDEISDSSKANTESEQDDSTQTDNTDSEILDDRETGEDQQTIVSRDINDDLQCPDPTPVRGTMKILHGHPYSYGCNVLLTCDPGLVFADGKSVWNLTCLAVPVTPPELVWVPVNLGKPICRDSPQCPDPTPVRGTMKILSGTPYSDGCTVLLTCDPGLVFDDGKSVWNLTCTPLPVIPNKCIWLPQYEGKPTCKEPTETDTLPEEKEENTVPKDDAESEPQINNKDIDSYGPEEDLDGTFHENYIENKDSEETIIDDMNDKNNDILLPSKWEETEEFTNSVGGPQKYLDEIEIYDDIMEHSDNKPTENVELYNENENNDIKENYEEDTGSEEEKDISLKKAVEPFEIDYFNEEGLVNESDEDFSDPETIPAENIVEENDNFEYYTVGENENQGFVENIDNPNESEEENEVNSEVEEGEHYESQNEEETEEEDEDASNVNTEATIGELEEEETENEEEGEQEVEENHNQEKEETEEENDVEIETKDEGETEEQEQNEVESEDENEEETEQETEEENTEESEETENEEETDEDNEEETEEENTELENDEESEEEIENQEDFDEVYPLQPPSIKEPSIIYAALTESSLLDKTESEEETEEEDNDNLTYEEVDSPGSLVDVQIGPVRASKEQIQTDENDCSLPAETGPCRAYFRRYFLNSKSGECDVFVYGGCQGNGNNFKTLDECENTCVRKIVNL